MSNETTATSIISTVFTSTTSSTTSNATIITSPHPTNDGSCDNNNYCNPVGLLIAVILLVLLLYIILALTRVLLCFVYRRRQQNDAAQAARTNRDIEEIGHPFSYLAERGFDNNAFVDPPPTYEQLFKRDEPPPVYETPATQRRAAGGADLSRQASTSSITSAPATYSRSSFIPRSTSRSSLPTGVFGTSVPPVSAILIDDSRSRTSTTAESPDDGGFSRPTLLVPERSNDSVRQPEAGSPTRENLI